MKIVAFGDTHAMANFEKILWPICDVIICTGDFSGYGNEIDVSVFNKQLKEVKNWCEYILVVPGNHDCFVERAPGLAAEMLDNAILLIDKEIVINDIKFYGTPWTLPFNNWSFMKDEEGLERIFHGIPKDTDVLISHGPPYGILDNVSTKKPFLGSKALLKATIKVRPSLHVFGHIHYGGGKIMQVKNVKYTNVSLLNEEYEKVNDPLEFEI